MRVMSIEEQKNIVAGYTCPLCGYTTWSTLAYSAHGWGHLLTSDVF